MKKLIALAVTLAASFSLLTGCVSQKAAAYKTLASVGYTVDGAMMTYAKAYKQGLVKEEVRAKITNLHDNKFNPAYRAAIVAAQFNYEKAAPQEVLTLAQEIVTSVNQIAFIKPAVNP